MRLVEISSLKTKPNTGHMSFSDSEIWWRLQNGDASAWGELVNRYQALVYTVANSFTLSMPDVADCFQQTWTALYEKRRTISNPSRLAAWLVTTAKREAIRISRMRKRESNYDELPEQKDPSSLPDVALEFLERQALLESALAMLDLRCRSLLDELFFAEEEKSYEQVAKSVGIAFNSLGPIRGRCLSKLRSILMENGWLDVRGDESESLSLRRTRKRKDRLGGSK